MQHTDSKFVFFGTPRFAEIVLASLAERGLVPSLVVTNPDRPAGRKKTVTPPPVKELIAKGKWHIEIVQPEHLANGIEQIANGRYEFAVLAAYGKIVPRGLIKEFPKGIIVVHPSLLPKYRGATPIQNAILNGDAETGVTLFVMDEKVDHGRTISKIKSQISNTDTYTTLEEKLAKLGAELLIKTLPDYLSGKTIPEEQDHAEATYTKKFATDDAFVPYENLEAALMGDTEKAVAIDRMVRALNPEPGAWTVRDGKRMKLLESRIVNGAVMLTKVQMEGKKPQVMND